MKTNLLNVSVRQGAIYVPKEDITNENKIASKSSLEFLVNIRKLGYTVSEKLLQALDNVNPSNKLKVFDYLSEVTGTKQNWAPLVKGWNTPTGESQIDHLITFFANTLKINKGKRLACGHLIPDNTFPLERYNGCPFCGTPFEFARIENYGQGSKLKVLELWTEDDLNQFFKDLLESRTALDATQVESLKILINELPLPSAQIIIKETMMMVIDLLIEKGEGEKAQQYFSSPNDILRYLWYKKTGFLQIVEPKTIISRTARNNAHIIPSLNWSLKAKDDVKAALKLKYTRAQCRMVATWLNNMEMLTEKACETMHPKRGMWVRFIRALRLAEYASKPGFEKLKELMDVFYNQGYEVWQGDVDRYRLKMDSEKTFALLKQRPGLFARSLFANILWFGVDETLMAFSQIIDKIPARLVFTLNMYASNYFDPTQKRSVKPLGGTNKMVEANKFLGLYSKEQLKDIVDKIENLSVNIIAEKFAKIPTDSKTMYIEPQLFNIPLSIGDRSDTVQDMSSALLGTRFPVEGDTVRLFMQWGKGLPAQHLDMDLSCYIAFDYQRKSEICSFYQLEATGAVHSGDIRSIPDQIGTAEYINLNINELILAEARYVAFTCNAYSNGAISPNMVVGWMNSEYPMKISKKKGVAYDPSCVQHQVRITQGLTKGLVFGVLDVQKREIIWLEMPFEGKTVANMRAKGLEALINNLNSKTTIGRLLTIKAYAQNIELTDTPEADEVYTLQWAMNTAAVTKLLID